MSKYFHTSARLSVCNRNRSWGIPIRIGLDWIGVVIWGKRVYIGVALGFCAVSPLESAHKKNEIIIIIMIMVVTHTRTETSLNYGKGRTAFQTQTKSFASSLYFWRSANRRPHTPLNPKTDTISIRVEWNVDRLQAEEMRNASDLWELESIG